MSTLQGLVLCATVCAKQVVVHPVPIKGLRVRIVAMKSSGFWRNKNGIRLKTIGVPCILPLQSRNTGAIHCIYTSSSNENDSKADTFSEKDEDYVISSVFEAVEVSNGADGFNIMMRDGEVLKCIPNNPKGSHLQDHAPYPAIVLKMEDGTGRLLAINVLEMSSSLLMDEIQNAQIARPTVYHVIKEMVEKMGYKVKVVRVTKRVHETYFGQIYLTKVGNEAECISFDIRPSDAINVAVKCKVPIHVNKILARTDGVKVLESAKPTTLGLATDVLSYIDLDRSTGQVCVETKEFYLRRNMLEAAYEERYDDAAQWRDKLNQLLSKRINWT